MFHMCGLLKDQGIKYLQNYHYFDCQNSTLTWLCWSETEQCVYRMIECMNVLYEWNENHKISDQRKVVVFACEKLGQVHVMMFVLGENLGLMRFAAAEQQPATSHLLPTLLRWSGSRAPHTLKNTNLFFSFWNFCTVLIYLTYFLKAIAMFVFIGGAANGKQTSVATHFCWKS